MPGKPKGSPKTGGRQKGTPNKITQSLKEAILLAASNAGRGDIATYLEQQARDNPAAFMSLLGRVLPTTLAGDAAAPLVTQRVERVIVDKPAKDKSPKTNAQPAPSIEQVVNSNTTH